MYDQIFSINVKSVFFFIKEARDLLKKSSQGANVLITSSLSGIQPGRIVGVYAMSKAAVISMAQWLAQELIDSNIRVNAVAPGFTRTNMIKDVMNAGIDKFLPKGAIGNPEDVAAVACMICSRVDGSFVNGETFPLSGGERNPKFKLPKL